MFLLDTLERLVNGFALSGPADFEEFVVVVMCLASILIFIGAINMRYGTRYRWAYAAAVIASIPMLTPLYCCGLPLGIWALVVLHRPGIKAAFDTQALQQSTGSVN